MGFRGSRRASRFQRPHLIWGESWYENDSKYIVVLFTTYKDVKTLSWDGLVYVSGLVGFEVSGERHVLHRLQVQHPYLICFGFVTGASILVVRFVFNTPFRGGFGYVSGLVGFEIRGERHILHRLSLSLSSHSAPPLSLSLAHPPRPAPTPFLVRIAGETRKVDIRLPGKGDSNSHSARPVYLNNLDDTVDLDQQVVKKVPSLSGDSSDS